MVAVIDYDAGNIRSVEKAVAALGKQVVVTRRPEEILAAEHVILPGVGVSLDALINRTSQLPKISFDPPKKFIGSNTVDCMKSGVLYGNACCIDGMIGRIWEELGMELKVVATGGMAKHIIPYCREKIQVDDALLLKGLKLIYKRNA